MRPLPYALLLTTLCATCPALAQDSFDKASTEPRSGASRDEAARRFARGLELFNEADYTAALVEFRRAYTLAPNHRVLYNIGQVCFQLQNYACALQSLEQYLSEGGSEIPSTRRTAVEADVEKLRSRVARLNVRTNVRGATILVDDVPVGKAPLNEPVLVSAGMRKVTVSADGRSPVTRSLSVAGEENATVELEFPELARLRSDASGTGTGHRAGTPSWPFWLTGGSLAVGATVTGVLALGANSDLSRKRDTFGVSASDLRASERRASDLALVTDILGGLAIVSGGFALYTTLSSNPKPEAALVNTSPSSSLRVTVGVGSVRVGGSF